MRSRHSTISVMWTGIGTKAMGAGQRGAGCLCGVI